MNYSLIFHSSKKKPCGSDIESVEMFDQAFFIGTDLFWYKLHVNTKTLSFLGVYLKSYFMHNQTISNILTTSRALKVTETSSLPSTNFVESASVYVNSTFLARFFDGINFYRVRKGRARCSTGERTICIHVVSVG
ncbi:uncharacterized protein EV154DRAFT_554653 [Mucor mucedo]|uniref:uncharacterized protein n=1 Tax=Mucor mucedo TaxID=29922 RepID=UPI002220E397|nr:uncharacterized protein EV154DRAFT_554653 [Mucor mucedo]KAI7886367.1 hypothetical protein EV154DRAFT_554653 [Mucor mucedo]